MTTAAEVRLVKRGAVRELRVDGTHASVFRPATPLTGSVWDAMAASLLALPPGRRRELLVLGLGGGSVARLLRAMAPDAQLVGVERDAGVVEAARAHFDLDRWGVEVVIADALAYLRAGRSRFDLIVEDCFVQTPRGLDEPDWMPHPGLPAMHARLRAGGAVVCDTATRRGAIERAVVDRFGAAVRIALHDCANRVIVATAGPLDARTLRARIEADAVVGACAPNLRLRTVRR